MLNVSKDVVAVVGIAQNQNEYFDLFDKIFLLQCKEKTFLERLKVRTSNDFGKHPLEKEYILDFYKKFEKEMIDKGAIIINAEEPLDVVVENIISKI